jgi:hypothetical protein
MVERGKRPKLAILVDVDQVYVHCAKAFKRSQLWDPEKHADRSELPSIGEIIREQIPSAGMTATEIDEYAEESYRKELY